MEIGPRLHPKAADAGVLVQWHLPIPIVHYQEGSSALEG